MRWLLKSKRAVRISMNKRDSVFYFIVLGLLGALFFAWYMMNPNSPRFKKLEYAIYFESIQTLAINNQVTVNGLEKGYVKEMSLEGDLVKVVAAIDERVEIPKDSKILIQNHGLMGERVLALVLGESQDIYTTADKIIGASDKGTSELVLQANELINESIAIIETVFTVLDSIVLSEQTQESVKQIVKKAKRIIKKSESMVESHIENLLIVVQDVEDAYGKVEALSDSFDGAVVEENIAFSVSKAKKAIDNLKVSIEVLEDTFSSLERQENSAGKVIYNVEFNKRVQSLKKTLFKAKDVIKAQELKLNVDF